MKPIWPDDLKGKELFAFMKANKATIMQMKTAATKLADVVELVPGIPAIPAHLMKHKEYAYSNDDQNGELIRTIVMNTYNWLDSHDDVHQNNLFAKSLKERGSQAPHLHDHVFMTTARVGVPIQWSENKIKWSELGIDMAGDTMSLILESKIYKELNKQIYKDYRDGRIDQHSVAMQYVKLEMAINDPDYEDEYKAWVAIIDTIGNKALAEKQGYFFAIHEAKLIEGSAVLLGSNELTPTLGQKIEPVKTTQKNEQPPKALDVKAMVERYYKV